MPERSYIDQKNVNPERAEGTCQWALKSAEYVRWWESDSNDLLWISADPSCGKSVLAKSIIDGLFSGDSSPPPVTVCYFFFKDNDEQNYLAVALRSVLHQLFSQRPDLITHAIPPFEKCQEKLCHEVEELWQTFITATSTSISGKTICIFDALDECRDKDRDRLIKKLHVFHRKSIKEVQPIQNSSGSSGPGTSIYLKFLVTSRPYDHIQDQFQALTNSFPHLHLKGEEENDQIHEEINVVVKLRMQELAQAIPLSLETHQRLEEQLLQMKHRTYL